MLCRAAEGEDRREILMSLAPIGPSSSTPANTEIAKPVTPPPAAQPSAVTLQPDTVTVSAAGRAASAAADVDRDGDSK